MNTTNDYETLDPENWEDMRALAHRIVDDAITYLEVVRIGQELVGQFSR